MLNMIRVRLTAAAPLLRLLRLYAFEGGQNSFTIRKDTLPGVCLQNLHLKLCHVDWSSPIFNGLTELSLSYVLNDPMERLDGLLLLLSQLPLLCQLCLDNIMSPAHITFEDSFIHTQNMTKVSLCRLEKLTLTDPICWVMTLLARLEFPRSTIVELESNCDNPEDISMFIPFMAGRFSSHLSLPQSPPPPRSMLRSLGFRRSHIWDANWTIMCGTSNPANTNGTNNVFLQEQEQDSQFPLQISLNDMDQELPLGRIIPLLRALPLTHLNTVTLYSDIDSTFDNQNIWTEVFWDALELQIIEVGCCCVSYLYFSQSQLQSNLGPPDLSLGIDATPDLVRPSPAP